MNEDDFGLVHLYPFLFLPVFASYHLTKMTIAFVSIALFAEVCFHLPPFYFCIRGDSSHHNGIEMFTIKSDLSLTSTFHTTADVSCLEGKGNVTLGLANRGIHLWGETWKIILPLLR